MRDTGGLWGDCQVALDECVGTGKVHISTTRLFYVDDDGMKFETFIRGYGWVKQQFYKTREEAIEGHKAAKGHYV
jgi:hypothetical protein